MITVLTSTLIAVLSLFQAQADYSILGQVQDHAGKAACGVRVCALAADFDPKKPNVFIPCALSDERGRFTIIVGKPSKYTLVYDDSARGVMPQHLPFFQHPSVPLPEVLVGEGNVPSPVTITMLPKNGVLAGKAVDTKTGLPVEGLEFKLCHATYPLICMTVNSNDSSGYFKLITPHVPFIVSLRAKGFEDWLGPNGDKVQPITVAPETRAEFAVFLKRSEASAGMALSEPEKRVGIDLPAPTQLSPANDAVFDRYPRITKLGWAPVEGAVSYRVEVEYCDGTTLKNRRGCVNPQPLAMKNNPPTSGIINTTYEFDFVGANPGRWRVLAVDKEGREGFASPWRRFVYLQ